VQKPELKTPRGRPGPKWENHIKMYLEQDRQCT